MQKLLSATAACFFLIGCIAEDLKEHEVEKIIGVWESEAGSFNSDNKQNFDRCQFFDNGKFQCQNFAPRSDFGFEYEG